MERVVPLELGVTWEPNAPRATLRSSDLGNACLTLKAHPDDHDQRDVVITFDRCRAAAQLPFNDEALHQHPSTNGDSAKCFGRARSSAALGCPRVEHRRVTSPSR